MEPASPNSNAFWYGYAVTNGGTIQANSKEQMAGSFAATGGAWTGVTGVTVYVSPDHTKYFVCFFEMDFKGGCYSKVIHHLSLLPSS